MNTKTQTLYIVCNDLIVEECSAPWIPDIRYQFELSYRWERRNDWRTRIIEAADEREAINQYHNAIHDVFSQYGEYNEIQ